jgi:flagellar protein FlbD
MITLTRLNGSEFALNSDLIERIDATPDTVVVLVDGSRYVVTEPVEVVVTRVREHRAEVVALCHDRENGIDLGRLDGRRYLRLADGEG